MVSLGKDEIIYISDSKIMRRQNSIKNVSIELKDQPHRDNLLNKSERTSE